MLLSIIIPVFNVEPYLKECLDSVFVQDLTDCEVIAVNDGSTDGSRDILETYSGQLTIVDKTNGGLSSARNLGAEKAQGDYLYFLDSDDWLQPHAVASIKKAIGESDGADVVYLGYVFVGQEKSLGEKRYENAPLMDFKSFFHYSCEHKTGIAPNAVSYVFSSSYWRKAGLHYEDGIKYEDALFKYQLFVRDDGTIKAVNVGEPFYYYRTGREGSLSTTFTLKNFTDRQYIRKTAYHLWKEKGIKDVAYYYLLYDGCVFMFYEAWQCGLIKEYRKFWDKEDVCIMRSGVTNEREYGLWLLAKLHPQWMARYYANDLPNMSRRLTNIMLTVCKKAFYK